jgi:WD40 repeat protein
MNPRKTFLMKHSHALLALALSSVPALSNAALPVKAPEKEFEVSFGRDILPMLRNNCLPCHNKTRAKADINLETPTLIRKGTEDGPLVVPGKPEESFLFLVSAHIEEDSIMPPAKNKASARNLTPEELGVMALWIKQGAKDGPKFEEKIEWQPVATAVHNPIFAVALSDDGQFAATGRSNRVDIYHVPTGSHVGELSDKELPAKGFYEKSKPAHLDYVTAAVFTPDGTSLATGSFREVKVWKLKGAEPRGLPKAEGFSGISATSQDGKWFAWAQGKSIKIRDTKDGKQNKSVEAPADVTAIGFSKDGSLVVAGSSDGGVAAWSVAEGKQIAKAKLEGKPASSVTVLLEPVRILSAHDDNIIRVWEAGEGEGAEWKMARELKLHTKKVVALVPDPSNNAQAYSASEDGQAGLWDAAKGSNLRKVSHGTAITSIAVRPDGQQLATFGGNSGKLWQADGKQAGEVKGNRHAQEAYQGKEDTFAFIGTEVKYREAELKKAQEEQKKAEDRLKKAKEDHTKAAKEPVEEKKVALEKLEADRDAAEKELEAVTKKLAENKEKLAPLEEEQKKLDAAYKDALAKEKDPVAAEASTKGNADKAKQDFDAKQATVAEVQKSKVQPQADKIKAIDAKLAESEKQMAAVKDRAGKDAGLEAKKAEAEKNLKAKEGELSAAKEAIAKADAVAAKKPEAEKTVEAKAGELAKAKENEFASAKSAVAKASEAFEKRDDAAKQDEAKAALAKAKEAEAASKSKEAEVAKAKEAVTKAVQAIAQKADAEKAAKAKEGEVAAAKAALAQVSEAMAKMAQAQKELPAMEAALAKDKKEKEDTAKLLAAAQEELKKAQVAADASKKTFEAESKKAADAKVVADNARKATADAKQLLDEKAKLADDLKKETDSLVKDKEAPLKKSVDELQKKVDADRKEFDKINGPLQTAIRELANSEKDLARTKEELAVAEKLKTAEDQKQKDAESVRDKAKEAASAAESPILAGAYSVDGKFLYTTGEGKAIQSWSGENGQPCMVYPLKDDVTVAGICENGNLLSVAKDGSLQAWDLALRFELSAKLGSAVGESPLASRVTSVDISPDGKTLAIGGGDPSRSGEIHFWDMKNLSQPRLLEQIHSDTVLDMEFSPDGKHIATASSDKFVKVTEIQSGKIARSYEGHTHHVMGVSWRKTGREIVSSGADYDVKYWNFENGDRLGKGGGFTKEITSIHAYGNGTDAVATGSEGKISILRLGSNISAAASLPSASKYTHASDITPDGKLLAAGDQEGVLKLWTLADKKLLFTFEPAPADKESLANNK